MYISAHTETETETNTEKEAEAETDTATETETDTETATVAVAVKDTHRHTGRERQTTCTQFSQILATPSNPLAPTYFTPKQEGTRHMPTFVRPWIMFESTFDTAKKRSAVAQM